MLGPQNNTDGTLFKVFRLQRLCVGVLDKRLTQNRMQLLFSVLDIDFQRNATKIHCIAFPELKVVGFTFARTQMCGRKEKVIYGSC
jgi:hypothetical protein